MRLSPLQQNGKNTVAGIPDQPRSQRQYCELHYRSFSTKMAKELASVKVCCGYFKSEVEQAPNHTYGKPLFSSHIRVMLPITEGDVNSTGANEQTEE